MVQRIFLLDESSKFFASITTNHKLFLFLIFWLYLWHIDVPGPGIESETQLQPMPQLQQHQILLTHCAVPGIKPMPAQ